MPPPRQQEQHHLYLVLDNELEDSYTIHKIGVGDMDPDDTDYDLDSRARPLPEPPLLRVDADRGNSRCFVAHGTKIFAMPPSPGRAALALDTMTMAITAGTLPKANDQQCCCSSFVAVGDTLYSMDERETDDYGPCNFEALQFAGSSSRNRYWSWSSVPSQPPFDPLFVCCYAVHPDGRTIFFSVDSDRRVDPPFRGGGERAGGGTNAGATFSFDVEALTWTFRGYWTLPIVGEAHYDVELDAWVGFHDDKGRVCCCDVLPPVTGEEDVDRRPQAPPPKIATGRLFRTKGRRHRGGALVYMGNSTFCVVERVMAQELTREQLRRLDGPSRLLIYVRTFGLKYDNKGRLRLATCGRRACCYALPEGTSCQPIFMSLRALWV